MSYKIYEVRVYEDGSRWWYLNGEELSEAEWKKAVSPVKELTVKEVEELLGHRVKIVK